MGSEDLAPHSGAVLTRTDLYAVARSVSTAKRLEPMKDDRTAWAQKGRRILPADEYNNAHTTNYALLAGTTTLVSAEADVVVGISPGNPLWWTPKL
jgi:hypothetical protein